MSSTRIDTFIANVVRQRVQEYASLRIALLTKVDTLTKMLRVSVGLISIVTAMLALRPQEEVVGRPITEDGYYGFSVARNLALGRGMSADGVTPTNGIQPLFTFLLVPLFLLSPHDLITPIRFVYGFQWLLFFASALLLGKILVTAIKTSDNGNKILLFWIGVFTYSASVLIFLGSFNGLETGFLLFTILATIRYYQQTSMSTIGEFFRMGCLLGILVLVRIDQVFLVILISVVCLLLPADTSFSTRFKRAAALSGTAFLISSPWWAYSLFEFGSLMPSSGTALLSWQFSIYRIGMGLFAIFCNLMPVVYFGQNQFEGSLGITIRIIIVVGAIWLVWLDRSWFKQELQTNHSGTSILRRTIWACGILLASNLILGVWYALSSIAVFFYVRYLAGAAIASVLLISLLLWKSLHRARLVGVSLIFMEAALMATALTLIAQGKAQTYLAQLALVEEYVPAKENVAAYQSGTLGYFRERVINLDGKVNAEALSRQNDIGDYLKERNVNWICDAGEIIPLILRADSLKSRTWQFVGRRSDFVLFCRSELSR